MRLTTPLGSYGLAIDSGDLARAGELERLGWSSFWVAGGQLERLDLLDELAAATASATVASAIIQIGTHAAADVAELHSRLAVSAPGRFVAGLGGPQTARPLAGLHAFLDELDLLGVGPAQRLIAALGPRKLAVAHDRSAGAITLLVTPEHTASDRETLDSDATLVVDQFVVLETDPHRARDLAREPVRFLAQVAGYRANFTRMGFTDDEIAGLDDRLIDELVAWGSPERVLERLEQQHAAGADHVIVSPLGDHSVVDAAALAAALFASSPQR